MEKQQIQSRFPYKACECQDFVPIRGKTKLKVRIDEKIIREEMPFLERQKPSLLRF